MRITVTSTYITIGETTYPLNSLYFKSDGNTISIFLVGTSGSYIAQGNYADFSNSAGAPFASESAVMTLLKTSLVTP